MKKKVALFAFNGDSFCFMHVMLHTLEMHKKGWEIRLVIEGQATGLVEELSKADAKFHDLYNQVKNADLIDCVCKACATKTGSLDSVVQQNLYLCDELQGHPSIARYIDEGFEIITF